MEHLSASDLFGILAIMLGVAKVSGALAQAVGQPAVLGELVGGVVVGRSALGLVDTGHETIHNLSELGVFILLLAIGLETDFRKLLRVGITSTAVAVVGVALPFGLGYAACRLLGLNNLVAIMAGATLTATSVGITARVLGDLGRLRDVEGQVILGAAVLDDILGLVILTVVAALARGETVTTAGVASSALVALGFLVMAVLAGRLLVPCLVRKLPNIDLPGTPTILALILAFGLAWLAEKAGSAMILGAFAAGMVLAAVPRTAEIEHGVTALGHFFVPIFFVGVGASVDLRSLDPGGPVGRSALLLGAVLIVAGIVGKFAAGYAPFWFKGDKKVIGVGMIPRGEVGLIFAQMGVDSGVFDQGQFAAATLMVLVTTFLAPPLLKGLLTSRPERREDEEPEGIEDLVSEA
ncbi:MAG: cation:proton antiporter [Isosphaeraceae bacterium]